MLVCFDRLLTSINGGFSNNLDLDLLAQVFVGEKAAEVKKNRKKIEFVPKIACEPVTADKKTS